MAKIAYVTDLHLTPNSPRIAGLVDATARLKDLGVRHLFMGGDLIGLPGNLEINAQGQRAWDVLKTRPVASDEYKVMFDYTKALADEVFPQFIAADPDLDRITVCGNADYIGYRYMQAAYAPDFSFLDNLSVSRRFSDPGQEFVVKGMIGVPVGKGDETAIYTNNPWYGGISDALPLADAWQYILMTHMPAYSQMDTFKGVNQGNENIGGLVNLASPTLHLTGHVHDAPESEGRIYTAWSGRLRNIVSVNPGGGNLHDPFIRMAIINLDKLRAIPNADLLNAGEALAGAIKLMDLR